MFKIRNFMSVGFRHISTTKPAQTPVRSSITLAFSKYLLLTNTVSSGLLMFIGDLIQQEMEYRKQKLPERYDYRRLTHMTIVGFGLGPLHHYFYIWLAKILPGRNATSVTKKILMDQFVMSPLCISAFFYSMGLLEKKSLKDCTQELKDKAVEVYMMDWCVWPPTQFINFYYVPVRYQVFYINFVTMLYNVFLSYIKHREAAEEYSHKIRDKKVKRS